MDNGLKSKNEPIEETIVHGSTGFDFLSSEGAAFTPLRNAWTRSKVLRSDRYCIMMCVMGIADSASRRNTVEVNTL